MFIYTVATACYLAGLTLICRKLNLSGDEIGSACS
jgi:hypothetical protein